MGILNAYNLRKIDLIIMEIRVPLFKLFVYSVVDVVDEFEEVNGRKNTFLSCDGLVIFMGSHFCFEVFESPIPLHLNHIRKIMLVSPF